MKRNLFLAGMAFGIACAACVSANSTRYVNVPIYDSPCLLAERAALKLQ